MTALPVANTPSDSALIDQPLIDSLSSVMSESALRSLLIDVERDVRLRLERLAEVQVATGSLELIAQDAHDIKSMGGNFGLPELSLRAGLVERHARAEDLEAVRAAVPPLISTGQRSLALLEKRPEYNGGRVS